MDNTSRKTHWNDRVVTVIAILGWVAMIAIAIALGFAYWLVRQVNG